MSSLCKKDLVSEFEGIYYKDSEECDDKIKDEGKYKKLADELVNTFSKTFCAEKKDLCINSQFLYPVIRGMFQSGSSVSDVYHFVRKTMPLISEKEKKNFPAWIADTSAKNLNE